MASARRLVPIRRGTVEGDLPDDEDDSDAEHPSPAEPEAGEEEEGSSSGARYRTQRRGGKGLRDIKTTERNGPVIGIAGVRDDDEILMITARGKLQRIVAGDVSVIGRNTQGVRIMTHGRRRYAGGRRACAARGKRGGGGSETAAPGRPQSTVRRPRPIRSKSRRRSA